MTSIQAFNERTAPLGEISPLFMDSRFSSGCLKAYNSFRRARTSPIRSSSRRRTDGVALSGREGRDVFAIGTHPSVVPLRVIPSEHGMMSIGALDFAPPMVFNLASHRVYLDACRLFFVQTRDSQLSAIIDAYENETEGRGDPIGLGSPRGLIRTISDTKVGGSDDDFGSASS